MMELERTSNMGQFIVEINYVCADFIGDSITKLTSNLFRGYFCD